MTTNKKEADVPDFSILLPHYHTDVDKRALRVALDTIVRHTVGDYELIVQAHRGNNAYPMWNAMAKAATTDWLIFTVSDHFVSPAWDVPLWEARDENTLVMGGLVESGFRSVAEQCIEHNFGMSPEKFEEAEFNAFAATKPPIPPMEAWVWPWIIHKEAFFNMGSFGIDPTLSDMHFFRAWIACGRAWKRVESYSYHLMNWTSTGAER